MKIHMDAIYIGELKKGSHKAFTYLYDTYSDNLYGFILLHTKSPILAEEIVQDTFLKIWLKKDTLNEDGSFKSLLFTMAKNQFIDNFRSQINKTEFVNFIEYCENENLTHNSVETDIYFEDFCDKLNIAKKVLPEKQRLIFELSREKGLDTKRIAEKLDISEQTVKNQLTSALKTLREKLKEYNFLYFLYL